MEAWPQERTKRSRPVQSGFAGLYRRYFVHSRYDSGASPIGVPGCPDFAFWTASTDRNRMVLIARSASALFSTVASIDCISEDSSYHRRSAPFNPLPWKY